MATDKRPTMLRLPDELFGKIRELAYLERRSMNSEIEHVIRLYVEDYEQRHGQIKVPEEE